MFYMWLGYIVIIYSVYSICVLYSVYSICVYSTSSSTILGSVYFKGSFQEGFV